MVDKLLGDGIVALFGAPVAHEDDADRAVRAGLTMQQTLAAFRDEHPPTTCACVSVSTRARCWSGRWPAPTTRRWATS
ncbi:MAG: hypothetical protein R2697_12170 [Ilumatobacteraceae bacterium]